MARKFWPLVRGHIVTSGFGTRWGTTHWGVDFGRDGGSGGMPVYAVQGGTVVHAGPASGFGQWVVVDHPAEDGGGTTVYGHIIPEVDLGQRVEAGQQIARINPDSTTNGGVAPHMHLEWHRYVWSPPGPDRLDPLPLLDGALYPGEESAPAPLEPGGLTAEVLSQAMGGAVSMDRYRALLPTFVDAMIAAECTTVERAAMWCAQLGTESGGLQWMEELASGADYEGRRDLGNSQPGDGRRFKGRGPIQVTGRHNYGELSRWAHGRGLVPSSTFFLDQPEQLASDRYGFIGAVWYWTAARPQINALADARDIVGVTRAINGGINGLPDRQLRYQRCLNLGAALLPATDPEELTVADIERLERFVEDFLVGYLGPALSDIKDIREQLTGGRDLVRREDGSVDLPASFPGWPQLGGDTVVDALGIVLQNQVNTAQRLDALEDGRNR